MDIRQVQGYMHERLIGCPIATDDGYKIVIPHGLGLLPECNYSALALHFIYSGYHPQPWGITLTYLALCVFSTAVCVMVYMH